MVIPANTAAGAELRHWHQARFIVFMSYDQNSAKVHAT